jgi:hypothetical protein
MYNPLGVFRLSKSTADNPKVGDYIALTWKSHDGSIWEGTEGSVVGTFEDNKRSKHLLIDRSTYSDSLKSVFYSLGLMDLFMVDTSEIESILELQQRDRPPGIRETMRFKMEIDYKSNIDYESTRAKLVKKRDNCLVETNQPVQTDGAANFTVKGIDAVKDATISFSPLGNVQIHCFPKQLNQCIKWLNENVDILPNHKHLVLIPTHFMLNIHDNFNENAKPTDELIERLAMIKQDEAIIFPLGWVNHFFNDLDENALKLLFPEADNIETMVLKTKKGKTEDCKAEKKPLDKTFLYINFGFPLSSVTSLKQPLSAEPPVLSLGGLILKDEEANGMKNMWFRSRLDQWQNLNLGPHFHPNEKVLIRNVIINRKIGEYEINFRKYYGTNFETW